MRDGWTNEVILEFLELYEKYPIIWNPQNENNKNRRRNVADAWNEIKNQLSVECTVNNLKRKKESLMVTYRFNKKKILDSVDPYKPTWFAFPFMDGFLKNIEKRRPEDTETKSDETIKETNVSELKTKDVIVPIHTPVAKPKTKTDSLSSFSMIENNVKQACEALQTISKSQNKREYKSDECDIYGQLVASKLRTISERSRLYLINQIDNLIFKTQLKEMVS